MAAADGNAEAKLARAVYVERVRKYIGAFLVKLNGDLDALVFTAGVGENDKGLREMACEGLGPLGIEVDPVKNQELKGDGEIQTATSRAKVMAIHTEEELSIATQSLELTGLMDPVAAVSAGSSDRDMSPKQFMSMITSKAKSNKQHMVLPEGHDPRILAACGILLKEGICSVTTLGKPDEVAELAAKEGVDITGLKIIDYKNVNIDDMVAALAQARKLEPAKATEMLR